MGNPVSASINKLLCNSQPLSLACVLLNLFNLFGTGNDLNTGTFLTLNGKRAKDSIEDFRKAFSEANLLGGTKKGTLFSWLTGNFNNDYDLAKDLDNDVVALQAFMSEVKKGKDPTDAINDNLKNAAVYGEMVRLGKKLERQIKYSEHIGFVVDLLKK